MIVVAIIGILAALAIYGVRKYLTSAKTGEAKNNLGRLGKDAVAAYEREQMDGVKLGNAEDADATHKLCTDSSKVPRAVPAGEKVQPDPSHWDGDKDAGWKCLRFSVDSPVYYQYFYDWEDLENFNVTATGDLNADVANTSVWKLEGGLLEGQDGKTRAMRLAPNFIEPTDPEE